MFQALRVTVKDASGVGVVNQEFISNTAAADAATWLSQQVIPDGGSSSTDDFTEGYHMGISAEAQAVGAKVMAKVRTINQAKNLDQTALLALHR